MTFNPNLTQGVYRIYLYVPSLDGSYTSPTFGPLYLTVTEATGIENIDSASDNIILYPQPATDVLNIRTSKAINSAEIYNMTGQLIMTETLSGISSEYTLSVGALSTGSYVLVLKAEDGVYREKFIKK